MQHVADATVPVTLAEISRIAGVGRAAVSNWRRRYHSFPDPIGGTDASPQFALDQIHDWLRGQGKLQEGDGLQWLWPEFEALGDRDATGFTIAEIGNRLAGSATDGTGLSDAQRHLVQRAVSLAEHEGGPTVFDFLLRRWLETNVRQLSATPAPLARLMAQLAAAHRDRGFTDVRSVTDPACGTGELLLTAAEQWSSAVGRDESDSSVFDVTGSDIDSVQAHLTAARLALVDPAPNGASARVGAASHPVWNIDVRTFDALRTESECGGADVVLCAPPTNQRDWGHHELTTDPRWIHGIPPQSEPELAWVQHIAAGLAPGGVAVLLLPPTVAARRAGKRIRASILRSGLLRTLIALPPGCAPPHNLSLHLWVLCAPSDRDTSVGDVLFIDATRAEADNPRDGRKAARAGIKWSTLHDDVLSAVEGSAESGAESTRVPVVDLLDEHVDLTPTRHAALIPASPGEVVSHSWAQLNSALGDMQRLSELLSHLVSAEDSHEPDTMTVGELFRGGALEILTGHSVPEETVRAGDLPAEAVPVLTLRDLLVEGTATGWLPRDEAATQGTTTAAGDVIVAGATRAFDAWVETSAPTVLGARLHALRAAPDQLDPWFLAGCLRAPANARQASTQATSTSRVDIRRLRVLRLPLAEQRRYGETFRKVMEFEQAVRQAEDSGRKLVDGLNDALADGRLRP